MSKRKEVRGENENKCSRVGKKKGNGGANKKLTMDVGLEGEVLYCFQTNFFFQFHLFKQ